ncbi:MAG: hypothetical protein QOD67_4091 [Caballeronia sp.]|jgi:ElaB/YqjD/DUF883 family membrane-anchored ribosome-binding protein|nr:hypothetical protein [Caballeronia sp.]
MRAQKLPRPAAHLSDVSVVSDINGKGLHNMSQTTVQMSLGKQKIIEDIKVLLNDSEELVRLSASLPAEGVDALRTRLRDHVDAARNALESAQTNAQERYRASLDGTVQYTRDNPWQALGIAAGIGFLAGILVSR